MRAKLLALALLCAAAPAQEQRPNFVLILADDLGWRDLGCTGSELHRTPRLDAMAEQGLRFTQAYANAPNCAPSRACLMTGQLTPRHGIYTVGSSARGKARNRRLIPIENRTTLPEANTTIAELLAPAGYACASIGKWHLGPDPSERGFQHAVAGSRAGHPKRYHSPYGSDSLSDGPEGEYLTDRMTAEALEFVDAHADEPFFLYLPYFSVHTPIQGRADLVAAAEARGIEGAHYDAMVSAIDEGVGRLLDRLDELALSENTLVVFFSDNGGHARFTSMEPLRGSKGMLYEGGIREPLLLRWPGQVEAGALRDTPVQGTDLLPTFLELAGVTPPSEHALDGLSLTPLFQPSGALPERTLYWHFPAYLQAYLPSQGAWRTTPGSALRAGRWKLHEYFEDGRVELYDLENDPGEAHDLAAELPERAAALHARLLAWRTELDAPVPSEPEPRYGAPEPSADEDDEG